MADRCQHGIPVAERIALHNLILIFRLINVGIDDSLGLAVAVHHLFAPENIVLLKLCLEPLVDLILGLCALYDIQPVAARPLAVLGGDDLHLVAVLDHIIDIDQLAVHPRADHLVANRTVDGIRKVNGCGAAWKILDIAGWGETVDTVGKQVQIALDHVQEFLVV